MLRGWLFVYALPKGSTPSDRVKFRQRLLGADTSSWQGRYRYRRKGLLEEVPHWYVMPGVLLVGPDDHDRVRAFLKEWKALLLAKQVSLESRDLVQLGRRPPRP